MNNSVDGGCYNNYWQTKVEPLSLPVILQKNGYETFFAGKYLNQYDGKKVPPGWKNFNGLLGNSRYYNYTLNQNGKHVQYTDQYLTDELKKMTLNFLEQRKADKPFFIMITPPAPHAPYTPSNRHRNIFKGVQALRTPNFNMESSTFGKRNIANN